MQNLLRTLFFITLMSCFDSDDRKLLETQLAAPVPPSPEMQSVPITVPHRAVILSTESVRLLILYIIPKGTNNSVLIGFPHFCVQQNT